MKTLHLWLAAGLLFSGHTAWAQQVYRCGNNYSQTPCADGKAIQVDDARTPEQRKDRLKSAKTERQTADKMGKERQKEEAANARAMKQAEKAEKAAALQSERKATEDKKNSSPKTNKIPAYRAPGK